MAADEARERDAAEERVPDLLQVVCDHCQPDALWTREPEVLLRAFCRHTARCQATMVRWDPALHSGIPPNGRRMGSGRF